MTDDTQNTTYYEHPAQQEYYDKEDYSLLLSTIHQCENVSGLGCEIGVREGHGSYIMMKHGPPQRVHVAVDPYGNIEYSSWEVRRDRLNQYDDDMFYATMVTLYSAAKDLNRHLIFLPLEDSEFMARFGCGVPVYTKDKKVPMSTYAMVHIDGPHTTDIVMRETSFFVVRMERGGCIVYDDIQQYNHGVVHAFLEEHNFTCIGKTDKKAAYKRV